MSGSESGRTRIAVASGVCVDHDAISNAMCDQARVLGALGHEVRLFAQHSERSPSDNVHVVSGPVQLMNDPFFASADLVIFHFGLRYDLFNLLLLPHVGQRVVHFHNVTPPELLGPAGADLAWSSLEQLSLAEFADELWVVSAYNESVLCEWSDVSPDRIRPMELLVEASADPRPTRTAGPSEPVVLLSVGRFVPAKGLADLVDAAGALDPGVGPVRLVLAGSTRFSSAGFMEDLRCRAASLPPHVELELVENPDAAGLAGLYEGAHVFASASKHEGFCVPVIEALAAGCRVVATDAGALPDTVGPCGRVVPLGDRSALSDALANAVEESRRSEPSEMPEGCRAHLSRFGAAGFMDRLAAAVEDRIRNRTGGVVVS